MFDTTVVAAPQIKAGKAKPLAVTSTRRVKGNGDRSAERPPGTARRRFP
jgi:tripartite-type tricarboxylate transporter receptor subunit TctC